jgi:hypothetical protein
MCEHVAGSQSLIDQKNIIHHFWKLLGVETSGNAFVKITALKTVLQPFADAYKNVFREYADGESLDGFDKVYVKHLHDAADVLENL